MRLVRIGRVVWEVLAILDTEGPIDWGSLKEDPDPQVKKMRALLDHVARDGPPKWNKRKCEKLDDDILEFKAGPKKGPKLRVFWFYGGGRKVIVCTHSVLKNRATVPSEIDRANRLRILYLKAERRQRIKILDLNLSGGKG